MREVEFRAWDKEKKMWTNWKCYDNMFYFMDKNTGVWIRDDEFNRFSLMQYTGLKDRNGKKIFGGDICKWYIDKGNDYRVIKIEYMEGDSSFSGTYIDDWGGLNCISLMNADVGHEVIGNIHDNPELLEEVK